MPINEDVLSRIPGLGGYLAKSQYNREAGMAETQQAAAMVGLAKHLQDQQREAGLRSELAALPSGATDDQVSAIARKYASPDKLMSTIEGNQVRREGIAATRERAMATLGLQAQQHEQKMALAQQNLERLTNKDQRDAYEQQLKAYDMRFKQSLASAAAQYNLPPDLAGATMPPMPMQAAPQAAPQMAPPPQATPQAAPQSAIPPDVVAAAAQLKAGFPQQAAQGDQMRANGTDAPTPVPLAAVVPSASVAAPAAQSPAIATPSASPQLSRKEADLRARSETGPSDDPAREKSIQYWADVMLKGGNLPPGLARNREGAALVKDIMKRVATGEATPSDMLSRQAEFQGQKAGQRTLGTRTANVEMAGTEAENLAELAKQASDKVPRTEFKFLNDVEQAVQRGTRDPNLRAFVASNTSLINAYARAINPQGVGTVADKEHAREMLSTAFSKGDYSATVDQLLKEISAARKSPGQVRDAMREDFTGKTSNKKPSEMTNSELLKALNGR